MHKLFSFIEKYTIMVILTIAMLGVFIWDIMTRYIPRYVEHMALMKTIYDPNIAFWTYYSIVILAIGAILMGIYKLYEQHKVISD